MSTMNRILLAAAAALSLGVAPALAQEAGQQQQRKPQGPTVVKSFGGWDVRCFQAASPIPCDVWEATAFKNTGVVAVSVSVAYMPSRDANFLEFVVPLQADLQKGARIVAGDFTSPVLKFHHCERVGCYIVVQDGNAIVDAMRHQSQMKIRLTKFHGATADLDVPLKGFGEAHAAMVELAKQKQSSGGSTAPADAPADSGGGNP
jgi:invasion protein IalB